MGRMGGGGAEAIARNWESQMNCVGEGDHLCHAHSAP